MALPSIAHPAIPTDEAFAAFDRALHAEGPRAALTYLVGLTSYRFIGIFRFNGGLANAAIHVDRENPDVTRLDAVPETATYCCYVRDGRGVFTTVDAMADPRLLTHVARAQVRSYCGVPLISPEGELLGTMCHYDLVPRDPEELDLPLLLQAAGTLANGGHVPPYPHADRAPGSAA